MPAWSPLGTFGPDCHNIHQLCRMQSQLLWNMEFVLLEGNMELIASADGSLCFSGWQGLVVHTPLLPVHPVSAAVWNGCHKSQIHPLESWEKSQGLPAVILIKHVLPRGKTQPLCWLRMDQILPSNPSVVVRDCWAWCWCPTGTTPSDPPGPSGTRSPAWSISPAVRSQEKVKPGLHSKSNGTQLNRERDAKHRFGRTKRSFHNLVLRNSITQR